MGAHRGHMSILRNGIIAYLSHLFFLMSHVEFEKNLCHNVFYPPCCMSLGPMLHVKFIKSP